jgi:hypothetical protein
MSNALLYRRNAADCLDAAERWSGSHYRELFVCLFAAWQALAKQDETIAKLLAGWEAEANATSGNSLSSRQYH